MIGLHVAGYETVKSLGGGSLGDVYLARHVLTGDEVAVKLLHPALSDQPRLVQQFFHEARAAAALQHPGIVKTLDVGHGPGGQVFVVMELVAAVSLDERIRTHGQFDNDELLRIARQIAQALSAAHAARLVHQNLKPANVFLCPPADEHGAEQVKLVDFGTAELIRQAARAGAVLNEGDALYRSPEQCLGQSRPDRRSDIYALGCIMYEMATGRPPFMDDGLESIAHINDQHLNDRPDPPRRHNPTISSALDGAITRCLAKQPDLRFQTMHELVLAIDPTAPRHAVSASHTHRRHETSPISTSATTVSAETATQAPRKRGSKVALLGVAALVAAGVVVGAVGKSESERDNAQKRSAKIDEARTAAKMHAAEAAQMRAAEAASPARPTAKPVQPSTSAARPSARPVRPSSNPPASATENAHDRCDLDEVACLLEQSPPPCCAMYGQRKRPAPRDNIPVTLSRADIIRVVRTRHQSVNRCSRRHPGKGSVKTRLTIAPSGRVTAAVTVSSPNRALGRCVARSLRRARFKQTQQGRQVTYPFVFR